MSTVAENRTDVRAAGVVVYSLLAAWLIVALTMGTLGTYAPSSARPPVALGLSVGVPILLFAIAYCFEGPVRRVARYLDLRVIVLLHVGRLLAINFLLTAGEGRLPMGFALPAGVGDIATALFAIPIAYGITAGLPSIRKWFIVWNLFGLADLVNAVAQGILHSSSTLGILVGAGPTTYLMTQLPRSLVPTFLVPLYMMLHLLALARSGEVPVTASQREGEAAFPCGIFRSLARKPVI